MNSLQRRSRFLARLVSIGLAGIVLAGSAAPALAAHEPQRDTASHRDGRCAAEWRAFHDEPTVREGIALGDCEIERRLHDLDVVHDRVLASRVMSDRHKAAVIRIIDRTTAGLVELRREIHANDTLPALIEDLRRIASDFRVYLLVIPQAHLTNAADAVVAIGKRFDTFDERASAYIERAKNAGYDTTAAEEALAAMNRHVAAAEELVDGLADAALDLTPADWNDGTAKPVLDEARRDLRAARDHLREARAAARDVIEALRALRD